MILNQPGWWHCSTDIKQTSRNENVFFFPSLLQKCPPAPFSPDTQLGFSPITSVYKPQIPLAFEPEQPNQRVTWNQIRVSISSSIMSTDALHEKCSNFSESLISVASVKMSGTLCDRHSVKIGFDDIYLWYLLCFSLTLCSGREGQLSSLSEILLDLCVLPLTTRNILPPPFK